MTQLNLETTILTNLIYNSDYTRKVIPYIKAEYFQDITQKVVFQTIESYVNSYKSNPDNIEVIKLDLQKASLNEEQYKNTQELVDSLGDAVSEEQFDWLVDETEKWCKDKAIYNAILDGIHIIDGKSKDQTPEAIPTILTDALSVSFDTHIGHDYMEQYEERYDFYHETEEKIPFDLDFFNRITKGGLPNKTLNVCLAGTGVGKSLFMCHVAAATLLQGKNVLYITLEMAEKKIAERIDANLMNLTLDDVHDLPKRMFESRVDKIRKKTEGQFIIKEYPTASAHCGHFRALYNELRLKKAFQPDIIFIDYINICASQRFKYGSNVNSYTYIKGIAEEMRGLAVELNLPIVSATQTTRQGFTSTDIGLEDTSESFGLPATADLMFALISTEELEGLNQMLVKQLKNRYNDPTLNKRFVIGVDRAKMKLYDVSQKAQEDLVDTGQPEVTAIEERFKDFKVE
jgi:replicative DNA helicase|tara:strand:+ start:910 stop:2286 length:1377 start_codon:yes stop_codon:yes gene_type:complete